MLPGSEWGGATSGLDGRPDLLGKRLLGSGTDDGYPLLDWAGLETKEATPEGRW